MKRLSITLPSLLTGRSSDNPPQPPPAATGKLPRARQRQLSEAEQRLLDQHVAEARQQARSGLAHRYATICRLCDRLGQPDLAVQLIEQGASVEQAVERLCGHATGAASFPSNEK